MANHQDAIKRNKQNEKRRVRNRHYRTMMRNQIKKLRAAVDSGDKTVAGDELRKAVSIIQRIAAKGVIHRRQAGRRVQRLNNAVKTLS